MSGGWTDTPLTELGRNQAYLIGTKLKESIKSEEYSLYTSDLLRAKQTAEIIGEVLELQLIQNKHLREMNTGEAIGKTKYWAKKHQNPMPGTTFDIDHRLFNGGETWREFFVRVCGCMDTILNSEKKNLIIVTHGGTLGYILAWWLKLTPQMLEKSYFQASPASITVLETNKYMQNVLLKFNDKSHLIEV